MSLVQVQPNGNGTYTQWTGNWNPEVIDDDDGTFIFTTTNGHQESYDFESAPPYLLTIDEVKAYIRGKSASGGNGEVWHRRSGSESSAISLNLTNSITWILTNAIKEASTDTHVWTTALWSNTEQCVGSLTAQDCWIYKWYANLYGTVATGGWSALIIQLLGTLGAQLALSDMPSLIRAFNYASLCNPITPRVLIYSHEAQTVYRALRENRNPVYFFLGRAA